MLSVLAGRFIKGGDNVSELRKDVQDCIDRLPDSKLEALRPLLYLLAGDMGEAVIETDLTDEEKAIIRAGREEYKKGNFIPLSDL